MRIREFEMLELFLLFVQLPCVLILLSRLAGGRDRLPPLEPLWETMAEPPAVSIVIPTLNEVERLPHCLVGLKGQSAREILVVDSNSQDGTRELVQELEPNFPIPLKLLTDPPLPPDWVGRPWALHNGYLQADPRSTWILGIDADTLPQAGLVTTLVHTAEKQNYDVVSLSPRFILKYPGEQWFQPALLITLIYRFGATGDATKFRDGDRVMANGQCLLIRRSWLDKIDGYSCAKGSFCDDVTLVRRLAQQGARVAFLDGRNLIWVRMYTSFRETWQEWGRSIDLKDASTPAQIWGDCLFLLAVQGLPLPLTLWLLLVPNGNLWRSCLLGLNIFLLLLRGLLQIGIRSSYTEVGIWFWLSPLADPLGALRIFLSACTRPRRWRGREYN
jgi:dolichol-phosphate mannosyltransferase